MTFLSDDTRQIPAKNLKDTLKERVKSFNTEVEEECKVYDGLVLADRDLRADLIKEAKQLLLVPYVSFIRVCIEAQFSKHPEKYIKFDKEKLEAMLGRIFAGTS